jgi:hypothetical protein
MRINSVEWYIKDHSGQVQAGKRLKRFLQIFKSPSDSFLLARIGMWALALPILKRVLPLQTLARIMWSHAKEQRKTSLEQKVATIVRWIYGFVIPKGACLDRSLILYRYLSGMRIDVRLVTGIKRTEEKGWKGHAWVLVDGKPFEEAEPAVEDFKTLAIFGSDGKQISGQSSEKN